MRPYCRIVALSAMFSCCSTRSDELRSDHTGYNVPYVQGCRISLGRQDIRSAEAPSSTWRRRLPLASLPLTNSHIAPSLRHQQSPPSTTTISFPVHRSAHQPVCLHVRQLEEPQALRHAILAVQWPDFPSAAHPTLRLARLQAPETPQDRTPRIPGFVLLASKHRKPLLRRPLACPTTTRMRDRPQRVACWHSASGIKNHGPHCPLATVVPISVSS